MTCVREDHPDGTHLGALREALDVVEGEIPGMDTHVLVRAEPGKNAALGVLISYARSIDADYFIVIDDDVAFEPGTLSRNVDALAQAPTDRIVIVGARTLTPARPLRSFLKHRAGPAGLLAWWWQSVFRLPFEPESEFFLFTPGPCLAMRVGDYPDLPFDDSGITDDAYINYWTVAQRGLILQPAGSIVYFHVASGYREWIRQQLRLLAGIETTLALFKGDAEEIRRVFAWAYSHNREARVPAVCRTPRRLLLLAAYRLAQEDLLRRYRRLSGTPDWGRAESTKNTDFGA